MTARDVKVYRMKYLLLNNIPVCVIAKETNLSTEHRG